MQYFLIHLIQYLFGRSFWLSFFYKTTKKNYNMPLLYIRQYWLVVVYCSLCLSLNSVTASRLLVASGYLLKSHGLWVCMCWQLSCSELSFHQLKQYMKISDCVTLECLPWPPTFTSSTSLINAITYKWLHPFFTWASQKMESF